MEQQEKAATPDPVAAFRQRLKVVEQGTIVLAGYHGVSPPYDYKDEIGQALRDCYALLDKMKKDGTNGQRKAKQCKEKLKAVIGLGEEWHKIVNGKDQEP